MNDEKGLARRGEVGFGPARLGKVWRGKARQDTVGPGLAGLGMVRQGRAWHRRA